MTQHAKYGNGQTLSFVRVGKKSAERSLGAVMHIVSLKMFQHYTCIDYPKQVFVDVDGPHTLPSLARSI